MTDPDFDPRSDPYSDYVRYRDQVPRTLTAGIGAAAVRHRAFDPALKQFDQAFAPTDTVVADPELRARWQDARRSALGLVLAAVAGSPWADSLVLRGSMLMSAWFGEAARAPKDIDFVVVPDTWRIEEPRTRAMLDGIAEAAERHARTVGAEVEFSAAGAVTEEIWTYERVPGHRLVIPWTAPGLPGGQVQLDFVFNEPLPLPAEPAEVAGVRVTAAGRELSLAWKLMWLLSDMYPQGKDLYDAVLLAESCPPPLALVERLLRDADEWPGYANESLTPAMFESALGKVDWDGFADPHADTEEARRELGARLLAAVAPLL
ncbi:nucleotidyl transferase AbiEii/AbiGii toxin family protein [Streptomyces sp. SKN60]|uniref:nucleotidyl transferase AbiEii/AbiGii toxin family protein n=1 Tax=Streptomyces sp. SKN60 TaxID=2855506 RepID=UPI002247D29A|nr:nucleotidyl transferase AbiEii/AbiGii toxin family protein [Streptomyces sp. SKN60]MCX2181754.1 nucleotidyl transferase AbiEii/AbiGii toxin family protein [Streptomyces sp. SKN60]